MPSQKARYVKLSRGCRVRIDAKPAKLAVRPVVALKRSIAVAHDLPEEQYRTGAAY